MVEVCLNHTKVTLLMPGGRVGDARWPCSSLDKWVGGITYEDWVNGSNQHIETILRRW
jgi:hypothetical protein